MSRREIEIPVDLLIPEGDNDADNFILPDTRAVAFDPRAHDGTSAINASSLSAYVFTNDYLVYWIIEVKTHRNYVCHQARARQGSE